MSAMSRIEDEGEPAATPHAERLLEFLHGLGQLDEPAALDKARWALLDALGCGLLGVRQPWGRIVVEDVLAEGSQGACTILGASTKVAPGQAALCNGTAMHGFELDDLLASALIHPGAVVVPAVLAAAETGDTPGRQLLRGIVAGYEAAEWISLALGTEPSTRGFHKTSVVGPVAAAIAAGVALGLDLAQMRHAVGLACSCASGIKRFAASAEAGMVKRLHAGRAAEAGVRMALLARRGFTAPAGAIDGRIGLLAVYGGATANPELLDRELGRRWALDDIWVKVYPICGWIQGVVQLLLAFRRERDIRPEDVERIVVATSTFAVKHNGNADIRDTMGAQYSIPYCAAVALTGDPMDPAEYAPERYADPALRLLAGKVDLVAEETADRVYPKRFACTVTLKLTDGTVLESATMDAHGTPAHPCTEDERIRKFHRLAELSGCDIDAAAAVACVENLASTGSVRDLARCLSPRH